GSARARLVATCRRMRIPALGWRLLFLGVSAACAGCGGNPAAARVASAQELGIVQQSSRIVGRDGGAGGSAGGRSVWAVGGTVLAADDVEGSNWHHNSFSFTEQMTVQDGVVRLDEQLDPAGAPRYFVPPTPEEDAFNTAHRGDPCMQMPCGARW